MTKGTFACACVTMRRCLAVGVVVLGVSACGPDDNNNAPPYEPPAGDQVGCRAEAGSPLEDPSALLTVFSVPTEAEVASSSGEIEFTATLPGEGGGLRVVSSARPVAEADNPFWRERRAFEARRRAAIRRYLEDPALRKSHDRRLVKMSACDCDDTAMCWKGACVTSATLSFPDANNPLELSATLVEVLQAGDTKVNVLLDTDLDSTQNRSVATKAAQDFAATLPIEWFMLGQNDHTAGDRDEDGRINVVFTNKTTVDITTELVGFFAFEDFLDSQVGSASGNQSDILWARLPGGTSTNALLVGTLVHEYFHLMSHAVRRYRRPNDPWDERLWVDEGLAHLMEDACGYSPSNAGYVNQALSAFGSTMFASSRDTAAERGMSYLLLRHIVDTRAKAAGATHAAAVETHKAAASLFSELLGDSREGFDHPVFRNGGPALIERWMRATFASCNSQVTQSAAHADDYLKTGRSSTTGFVVGFDPYGVFQGAKTGESFDFDGPDVVDTFDSTVDTFDGLLVQGGGVFYVVESPNPSATTVEFFTSAADLATAHFDIEALK